MSEHDDYLPSIGGSAPLVPRAEASTSPTDESVTREQTGRYERRAEIGRGGIGRVWLGFDHHIGREVAIKELLEDAGPTPSQESGGSSAFAARFMREARVTGRLEHPAIVPVYELGQRVDGSLYYTMKVVRGRTLAEALADCDGLEERLALLQHFSNLCNAIAYAHARGVIHRDIKPANVMVGDFGETVVLDWGLAKVLAEGDESDRAVAKLRSMAMGESDATLDGHALGTPAYMSPEQAEGNIAAIDARSDVWGLGAVLYEILSGHPPYRGDTPYEIVGKVMSEPPAPILELEPRVPRELVAVADKALQREADSRYPRAADLAEEVESFRSGRRVEAHRYSLWELTRRLLDQHRSAVFVGALALVAAIVMASVAYLQVSHQRDRALASQREAQGHLARALYEKARLSVERKDWIEAETLAARALQIDEEIGGSGQAAPLRGLLSSLEDRWRPELVWIERFGVACTRMRFSPDGKSLACPTLSSVALLAADDGAEIGRLIGGTGYLRDAVWSDDGTSLAAVGFDGRLRAWTLPVTKPVAELEAHTGEALALAHGSGLLLSGGIDREVAAWRWSSGVPSPLWRDHEHEARVTALSVGSMGELVASADRDGVVIVREADGTVIRRLRPHRNRVVDLELLDGLRVLSASSDKRVVVSSLVDGEVLIELDEHDGGVSALHASSRASVLASGDERGTVRLWSLRQRRLLGRFTTHLDEITSVGFHRDSRRLLTASRDGVIRMWTVGERAAPSELVGAGDDFRAVTWSADGERIAAGGRSGSVAVWERSTGDLERVVSVASNELRSLSFDPTGALLATCPEDHPATWIDVGAFEGPTDPRDSAQPVRGAPAETRVVKFLPGRFSLLSGGGDGSLRLHGLDTGTTRVLGEHGGAITALDALGEWFASGSVDERVNVWSTRTLEVESTLAIHEAPVTAVAFVDARQIASGDQTGELALSGLDGELVRRWRAHEGRIAALDVSPDGTLLVSSGLDHRLRLWALSSGTLLAEIESNDTVYSLEFAPTGHEIAAVADGDRVLVMSSARVSAEVDAMLEAARRRFGVEIDGVDLAPLVEPPR